MIEGKKISVVSVALNMLFVFYHLWGLYVRCSVGLRQMEVVDYGKYDIEKLGEKFVYFGLMQPWITFAGILVEYFELPEEAKPVMKKSVSLKKS